MKIYLLLIIFPILLSVVSGFLTYKSWDKFKPWDREPDFMPRLSDNNDESKAVKCIFVIAILALLISILWRML